MKYCYPAIIHFENGSYWCDFPDLKGCFSQGDTQIEMIQNAQEAMEGHLLEMIEKKLPLPQMSDINKIKMEENTFCAYICCVIKNAEKSVKKTLTIPSWLNAKAEALHINFSQTLQEALIQKLN